MPSRHRAAPCLLAAVALQASVPTASGHLHDAIHHVVNQLFGNDDRDNQYHCSGIQSFWSDEKKHFCCSHQEIGCHALAMGHSPRMQYNCEENYHDWQTAWSAGQKAWCCSYADRGCEHGREAMPYDCNAGFAQWRTGWALDKKDWCCRNKQRGCQGTHWQEPYDCRHGAANWNSGWEIGKQEWCCQYKHVGCDNGGSVEEHHYHHYEDRSDVVRDNNRNHYDCTAGLSRSRDGWSEGKKDYCCHYDGLGCREPLTTDDYDCHQGYASWKSSWSAGHQSWCCHHRGLGCADVHYPDNYPCDDHSDEHWSYARKEYCCQTAGRGCLAGWSVARPQVQTAQESYDCTDGYGNWRRGWTRMKKEYCCQHRRLACESPDGGGVVLPARGETLRPRGDFHYDCEAGYSNWHVGWSASKKEWCCQQRGRACPESEYPVARAVTRPSYPVVHDVIRERRPVIRETRPAYDCEAGLLRWEDGWSIGKKAWCCEHAGRGCDPYDCHMMHVTSWDPVKTHWCCANKHLGCPTERRQPMDFHYDCQAGFARWNDLREGWSPQKQRWCCDHVRRGCPEQRPERQQRVAATSPYDCFAGYAKWKTGWSVSKKAWCCQNERRACPQTVMHEEANSLPYDCNAGLARMEDGWSITKKSWCCAHAGHGCQVAQYPPSTTMYLPSGPTSAPYDCFAGLENWRDVWAVSKKAWCCIHEQRGCHQTVMHEETTSEPYDCKAGSAHWEDGWSISKKAWCCAHTGQGCHVANYPPSTSKYSPAITTSALYDCSAGLENWRDGWAVSKKAWCCQHARRGCESVASVPYDCEVGFVQWQTGWSVSKKSWCCKHRSRGCAPVSNTGDSSTIAPYNCLLGVDVKERWPHAKERYCCAKQAMFCVAGRHEQSVALVPGTTSQLFDCEAGLAQWQHGWSIQKKSWCCQHGGHGCTAVTDPNTAANVTAGSTISTNHFNCQSGLDQWETLWSEEKKVFCQRKVFDCTEGVENLRTEWHDQKRGWCCTHENIGCRLKHKDGKRVYYRKLVDSLSKAKRKKVVDSLSKAKRKLVQPEKKFEQPAGGTDAMKAPSKAMNLALVMGVAAGTLAALSSMAVVIWRRVQTSGGLVKESDAAAHELLQVDAHFSGPEAFEVEQNE